MLIYESFMDHERLCHKNYEHILNKLWEYWESPRVKLETLARLNSDILLTDQFSQNFKVLGWRLIRIIFYSNITLMYLI